MSGSSIPTESFHLELQQIQGIINRQASNSFKIKKWTVTLVAVSFLFNSLNVSRLIGFIPLFGFWYLDAYYLRQERLYRELYDWTRINRPKDDSHLFDLSTNRFKDDVASAPCLMLSRSLSAFYIPIGGLLIVFAFIIPLPPVPLG